MLEEELTVTLSNKGYRHVVDRRQFNVLVGLCLEFDFQDPDFSIDAIAVFEEGATRIKWFRRQDIRTLLIRVHIQNLHESSCILELTCEASSHHIVRVNHALHQLALQVGMWDSCLYENPLSFLGLDYRHQVTKEDAHI